jgi:hypothetical protein
MARNTLRRLGFVAFALVAASLFAPHGHASGGGGGGVETIKVTKCEYAVTGGYVELLVSATSSNSAATLYAYLPTGQLLGPVFSGGRYGGTVFGSLFVPDTITIISDRGASVTVPCVPFQP